MNGEKTLPQQIVIYDAREETGRVYDTVYTESQVQATILRCLNRHGSKSNARVASAR